MKKRIAYSFYAALIVLASCGGKQSPDRGTLDNGGSTGTSETEAQPVETRPAAPGLPAIPDSPQPMPRELLATAAMDNPSAQMVTMGRFLDGIQPGMSAALNDAFLDQMVGNLVGLASVSGLDYSKPLRAVVLDPKQVSMPIVMVAAVADAKVLNQAFSASSQVAVQIHQGYAAMGTPQALTLAAPHALTALVAESAPAAPTLTVQSKQLLAVYGGELDMFMGMLDAQAASDPDAASGKLMMSKLMDLLAESDRMQMSLDMAGTAATGKLVVYPLADTGAARLAAQQKPSQFSLAAAVPGGAFFAAGQMSESLLQAMDTFNRSSMAQMYGADNADKLAAAMRTWYQAMGGEFAMSGSVSPKGMTMSGIWSVTDAGKARAAMKNVLDAMPKQATTAEGAKLTMKHQPRALRHKGITAQGVVITGDFKALPEDQRQAMQNMFGKGLSVLMAVIDDHAAFAMGPSKEATAQMRTFIDAAKGKKQTVALSAAATAVLEDARARDESMVFAFDLSAFLANFGVLAQGAAGGDWITFAMGFPQNTIELRLTVPSSAANLMIQMTMAGP